MIRAYRSEWLKLTRPGMLLATGILLLVTPLAAWISMSHIRATEGGGLTLARLAQPDGFLQLMSRTTDLIVIFALGSVATAVALEHQQGTLRNLLVRQPDRMKLLAGRLAAITTWLAATLAVATALAFVSARLTAPSRGIDASVWLSGSGLGNTLGAVGGAVLAGVCGGLIGAALALVLRSVAPAIVVGIAWLLPVEGLLVAAWSGLRPYLPGQALGAISAGGTDVIPFAHSVATAAVWVVGLVGVAALFFRQRDVTA
ncbi:MAG TPA: ABC transporter permease [Candidatus Dormibacteraeota bacterium]|nr:ABC transporter permease [Candidatus Dormibacteraeota bacterium]